MAAAALLLALVGAGLLPNAAGPGPAAPSPEVAEVAGLVTVDAGTDRVAVDVDPRLRALLPVGVEVPSLCPTCPAVAVGSPAPASAQPAPATAAAQGSAPSVAQVAAGTSVAVGGLGLAFGLARMLVGSFSRIEDGRLALHPLRRQALDLIAANPGASIQDVQRALAIGWGTAVYHLARLERAGLVAVRHVGRKRGHWPLGTAPAPDALAPGRRALVELVRREPGLSQGELARRAGLLAPAACKHLHELEAAGLVVGHRSGRLRVYGPGPRVAA